MHTVHNNFEVSFCVIIWIPYGTLTTNKRFQKHVCSLCDEKEKRDADQRFERICSLYEMFSRKDPYEDMTMNQVDTPSLC